MEIKTNILWAISIGIAIGAFVCLLFTFLLNWVLGKVSALIEYGDTKIYLYKRNRHRAKCGLAKIKK